MISLIQLLKEVQGKPKAIILAGAPGAGKGYILKGLDLAGMKIMNIDDIYINLLKQTGTRAGSETTKIKWKHFFEHKLSK